MTGGRGSVQHHGRFFLLPQVEGDVGPDTGLCEAQTTRQATRGGGCTSRGRHLLSSSRGQGPQRVWAGLEARADESAPHAVLPGTLLEAALTFCQQVMVQNKMEQEAQISCLRVSTVTQPEEPLWESLALPSMLARHEEKLGSGTASHT